MRSLDWCWHSIGHNSYPFISNSEHRSNEFAISGTEHHDLIGSLEHRCCSDLNYLWKSVQRIAVIIVMQMEHHR